MPSTCPSPSTNPHSTARTRPPRAGSSFTWPARARRIAALAALALLVSCGGGGGSTGEAPAPPPSSGEPGSPPAPVAQTVGGTVSGLAAQGLVLSIGTGSLAIAADGSFTFPTAFPSGTSLSVQVASQPAWQQCTVANGSVTIGSSPVTNVAVTCAGIPARFAYTANDLSNSVSMYRMDATTGALTRNSPRTIAAGSSPSAIAADLQGRFLFVANAGSDTVSAYTVDAATGLLAAGTTVAAPGQPKALAVHPDGKFLYVVGESGEAVQAYAIDAQSGALTAAGTSSPTGPIPRQAMLTPDGQWLVVLNTGAGASSFSVFRVDADTGALQEATGSPFNIAPASVAALHPNGKLLVTTDNNISPTDNVRSYALDPASGAVTFLAATTLGSALGVAFHPAGSDVYLATSGSTFLLSHYTIDAGTGQFTATADAPQGVGPGARVLAVDPKGRVLELLSGTNVYGFTVDATTRALTPIAPANATSTSPNAAGLAFVR